MPEEQSEIDLQSTAAIPVGNTAAGIQVLMNALVRYEVQAITEGRDWASEMCQKIARDNGLNMPKYQQRLVNEAVIQSLEAELNKRNVIVKRTKDKTLLMRALAALFIRRESDERRKDEITTLCNEIGINLEEFDTACADLQVPDNPERDLGWRTKDGKTVALRDMADSHLINAILFLEKSAQMDFAGEITLIFALATFKPTPRMWEAIALAKTEEKPEAPPMYWAMRREAERRGMRLPPPKTKDEPPPEKTKRTPGPVVPGSRAFNFDNE